MSIWKNSDDMDLIKQAFLKDGKNRCIYEVECETFGISIKSEILFFGDGTCEIKIYEDDDLIIIENTDDYLEARRLAESYMNYEVELFSEEEIKENCNRKDN